MVHERDVNSVSLIQIKGQRGTWRSGAGGGGVRKSFGRGEGFESYSPEIQLNA